MITTKGLEVFCKAVAETITKAVCTVDGTDRTFPIHSITVNGNEFKVNIYLDDTVSGTISKTKLYDKHDNVVIERADQVPKPAEKNLLIVFNIELTEVSP